MNSKQVKEFLKALDHIVEEKGIDRSIVVEAMEQGLAAAYKKNEGIPNVRVEVNPDTGEIKVFKFKNVVEEVQNEKGEISLEDAKKIVPDIEVGETIEERLYTDKEFGRVAAGTAKQVVVQRIKEAEKESVKFYTQGEGLFICGNRRMRISVIATREELDSLGSGGGL